VILQITNIYLIGICFDEEKRNISHFEKLNWFTIRFKNPYGIYKDVENNTDIEVYSREEILKYLSETTKNVL